MEMQAVSSSQIASCGWENGKMRIQFNSGGVYEYDNVPHDLFLKMMNAVSVSKFFAQKIKSMPHIYPYRKLTREEAEA